MLPHLWTSRPWMCCTSPMRRKRYASTTTPVPQWVDPMVWKFVVSSKWSQRTTDSTQPSGTGPTSFTPFVISADGVLAPQAWKVIQTLAAQLMRSATRCAVPHLERRSTAGSACASSLHRLEPASLVLVLRARWEKELPSSHLVCGGTCHHAPMAIPRPSCCCWHRLLVLLAFFYIYYLSSVPPAAVSPPPQQAAAGGTARPSSLLCC
jgi:hypothetical protein